MEIITKNGTKAVEIVPAKFKDAINLKKAVFECLKNTGILKDTGLDSLNNIDIAKVLDKLFSILLNAEISDKFETALFTCLTCCSVEVKGVKRKITQELFDELPDLKDDYYEIVSKCAEENLRPFFKSLVSELKTRFTQMEKDFPTQNTMQS